MEGRRNNLSPSELAKMETIAKERGGHSRFDFVQPRARTVYRCPIPLDPNNPGPNRPSNCCNTPINPNGLSKTLKRHVDYAHAGLGRDVYVRVERFNSKSQNLFLARPTKQPQQRRGPYGQATMGNQESPEQTLQEKEHDDHPAPDDPQVQGNKRPKASQTDHPPPAKYPKWVAQLRPKQAHDPPDKQSAPTHGVQGLDNTHEDTALHSPGVTYNPDGEPTTPKSTTQHRTLSPQMGHMSNKQGGTPSEEVQMEDETSQIMLDSPLSSPEGEQTPKGSKNPRAAMLALQDPTPQGCTEKGPVLTRYLAAYLSQTEGSPKGPKDGTSPPKKLTLKRCTSDGSWKWPNHPAQNSDPGVVAFHDSLLHLDQHTAPKASKNDRPDDAADEPDSEGDMEVDDPIYEPTGIQKSGVL